MLFFPLVSLRPLCTTLSCAIPLLRIFISVYPCCLCRPYQRTLTRHTFAKALHRSAIADLRAYMSGILTLPIHLLLPFILPRQYLDAVYSDPPLMPTDRKALGLVSCRLWRPPLSVQSLCAVPYPTVVQSPHSCLLYSAV